jgi:uncharacterized protein YndB with AHSA1/START domain
MSEMQAFQFEKMIKASPEQAYLAFTNATSLQEWLCDLATVDPKTGGRVYLAWNSGFYSAGEYLTLEKNKKVEFTWFGKGEPAGTQVGVIFTPRDGKTQVQLEHSGLGSGEAWQRMIAEVQKSWPVSLNNLASVLETGEDQRFTQRPMLGIGLSDFNDDIARHLGVPVTCGVRIDRAIEGMGAQAAGLESDDVLVSLGGREITDFNSIGTALQGRRAGDHVEVVFYRGAELKRADMVLSPRPMPEIPWSVDGLARAVRERYLQIDQELDEFFKDVSEEAASFRPSPDEWCVKEVVAHLIQSERSYQNYIADVVGGQEPHYDDYYGNLQARIDAILDVHETLAELRQELKRCDQETLAFFVHLPVSFLERKGSYWRIAYGALEAPYHHQVHLEQMSLLVQNARGVQPA